MHVHLVFYWVLLLICISTYPVIYYGLNIHLQYVFSLLIHELFQSMLFNLSIHIISQIQIEFSFLNLFLPNIHKA